ncbi:MAG: hypothetical protein A2Y62_03245 [Candidatus Fischerbacteria bacterium RBG_13_37_8]|uniref:Polymerase/histidinol phosphatase N-terminal domain-containing protein n=1 Tax=Candidatus Fischerbacteria bacterium RBG_13_37_8 TaxID=1817863 RepID=A0A1F5VUY6_9BACT|nr:MAG: hypothetical protein A2Y62_03245 [Candidatus Fischerbacteria bacterium RBG_13_37_8]
MGIYIDLHIHSCCSNDGLLSPEEIVAKAKQLDFKTIAIADHDTVDGIEEEMRTGIKHDLEIIPAIEVTTELNTHFYHILAYFIDPANDYIVQLISRLKETRKKKNLHRICFIKEMGLAVPEEIIKVIERGELIVGPTLSIAVMDCEQNQDHATVNLLKRRSKKEYSILFYKEIIKEIDRKYSERRWLSTLEAIKVINEAGAIPVLAHPGSHLFYASPENITLLQHHGLKGIEVYSSYHSETQQTFYKEIALQNGLIITGGSDFHGKVKPHVTFGSLKLDDYTIVEQLKTAARDWGLGNRE